MDVERTRSEEHGLQRLAPGVEERPSATLERLVQRVVRTYVLAGALWILVSDAALSAVLDDRATAWWSIAKGLLFVASTGAVLWVVLGRFTRRFDHLFGSSAAAQRDFYGGVLDTSSDLITILDGDGVVRFVNDAAVELLGWQPAAMVGKRSGEFLHPSDRAAARGFREMVSALPGRSPMERTFLVRHRDGTHRAFAVRGAPIELSNGEPGVVLNARDVTERTRSERQLRAALAEDVTGLPNLRMFVAEMEGLDDLDPGGLTATIALVDVDRFGDINDLYGRTGGDDVLRELARRLEAAVPEALGLWRHGADEFVALVLRDGDDAGAAAQDLADRIQGCAAAPVLLDEDGGARVSVELSVGVARRTLGPHLRGEGLSTQLLRAAETALGDAKRHPDRTALRLDPVLSPAARARLLAEVHDAVACGQLEVHYQPKVRLDGLTVAGVEALVRWRHPTRGLLGPGHFLGAVAEANLSGAVLRVVLEDSLHQVAGWVERPGVDADFRVCVNVSADDLRRRRFTDDVFGALADAGVDARRLCLELTEQTMLADAVAARAVVDELRAAGIHVAIDDFGTGYSTLEHIRVFEVDELKIDRCFVQRLGENPADEAIVDSILAISQRLDVRVVAEGIETEAALDYLRARGCTLGQGFLLGRPAPAADLDPTVPVSPGS